MITVALDRSSEDVRPYIEKARPTHPSLIDSEHRVAHLYGIINVSTVIWIDERGQIVRPNRIEYGSDLFKEFHGLESEPHLSALRAWVKEGKGYEQLALAKGQETASQRDQGEIGCPG